MDYDYDMTPTTDRPMDRWLGDLSYPHTSIKIEFLVKQTIRNWINQVVTYSIEAKEAAFDFVG